MKNFDIMQVDWKGGHKKNNIQGGTAKKGGLGQFVDLREGA